MNFLELLESSSSTQVRTREKNGSLLSIYFEPSNSLLFYPKTICYNTIFQIYRWKKNEFQQVSLIIPISLALSS